MQLMLLVTWVCYLTAIISTEGSLIQLLGLSRLTYQTELKCLYVHLFKLRWNLTLILVIFDLRQGNDIVSVSQIGEDGSVVKDHKSNCGGVALVTSLLL